MAAVGGIGNTASGLNAVVVGGGGNDANGSSSAILAGADNTFSIGGGFEDTIAGGDDLSGPND